jgi:Xaa-Pro aminopeptidase
VAEDVLIYGDTVRCPELRHEVPLSIGDPFLYAEIGGERHVVVAALELPRARELAGFHVHVREEFGLDGFAGSGLDRDEITERVDARAAKELGLCSAIVPAAFPLSVADKLRAAGIDLVPDRLFFDERRRTKTEAELAGLRRAQAAAEAGMRAAVDLLRRAEPNGAAVLVDGEPLTSERLKAAIGEAFLAGGCTFDELIVAHGAQTAVGHDAGSGAIRPGEPIVIDIWPRDGESACYADMTRTFVVGEPPAELVEYHRLVKHALDRALADIRPGVAGRAVYDGTCEIFEAAGYPTQRTKPPAQPLEEGFFHGLGHGVGLEVHEAPGMGLLAPDVLKAGDVVTVEPGLYRPGFGGCRLEDLVLVTEDGAENLTNFPYDLAP